mmetsp:Transcript_4057/g.6592  ORF Transcript_4057/g.6592 Transcript_4057/m.6592 type:complete len:552 (-) Transcript_4057:48-1703(-)
MFILLTLSFVALAFASSHSEAPGTSESSKTDLSDVYFFKTPGNDATVTAIVNLDPLRNSQAGPNYNLLDNNYFYTIHFDNDGDASEDFSFQFIFGERLTDVANSSPLRVNAPFTGDVAAFEGALSVQEYYEVRVAYGKDYVSTLDGGVRLNDGQQFGVPVTNTGSKTFAGNYNTYVDNYIYNDVSWKGCAESLRVFAGPRRESFALPLGRVFDLINLDPLTTTQSAAENSLDRFNVFTLALEIPTACLKRGGTGPVLSTWATTRELVHKGVNEHHFAGKQTSRLGNPLVNELIIGMPDKNLYSRSAPADDAQFLSYFQAPVVPALVELLFGAAAPSFVRNDLVGVLLTGVPGFNAPTLETRKRNVGGKPGEPRVEVEIHNGETTTSSSSSSSSSSSDSDDDDDSYVTYDTYENSPDTVEQEVPQVVASGAPLADVLRLNTAIAATPRAQQNPLGFFGGDFDGYPNGRRLGDDVVDITLRAAMGAVCHVTVPLVASLGLCVPADAPVGNAALTDGVPTHACSFGATFPYLNAPVPGDVAPTDAFPLQYDATC